MEIDDPVDQQSPEHDRAERQQAQHDRRHANVPDEAAVTEQLRRNEAQSERLILVAKAVIAFDEDDVARPCQGQPLRVEAQGRILARQRVLHHDMRRLRLRLGPQDDHGAAILQHQHGWQCPPHLH